MPVCRLDHCTTPEAPARHLPLLKQAHRQRLTIRVNPLQPSQGAQHTHGCYLALAMAVQSEKGRSAGYP